MEKRCKNASAQRELHGEKGGESHLPRRPPRRSHQNQPGLKMSLYPSTSLREPDACTGWGVFECVGGKRIRPQRCAGQAHAQIGILGYIPGIPAAQGEQCVFAKVIAGPPKQERHFVKRKTGWEQSELNIVFQPPLRRQP